MKVNQKKSSGAAQEGGLGFPRGQPIGGRQTEYKTIAFELDDYNEEEGVFAGYGAVFSNLDSGGDIIEPGAFSKTLAEDMGRVKILSGHNDTLLPIGKPLELREDAKGLFLRAKISDTSLGRDIKTLIRDKVLGELSIGYDPVTFEFDANGIRHLTEVKLWEISVVTWAMNDQAVITDFKAAARDAAADIKAGRKISADRMKSLEEACTSMKTAAKLLDKVLAEARAEGEKGNAPARTIKPRSSGRPEAKKQIIEIYQN